VCQEAALGPIRELGAAALRTVRAEDVRPLNEEVPNEFCYVEWLGSFLGFLILIFALRYDILQLPSLVFRQDFRNAVQNIRPSVSKDSLVTYKKWADQYGVAR
jgi:SpoVK/Ycf46/Vps4 family AAA+-type ATPase